GRGGEVHRAAQVRAGVVHGRGRIRVVDEAIFDDGRGERVARVVGDDDAQVVEAVGHSGRVRADRAPGAGVRRGGLEGDLLDADARVIRGGREVDRATQRAARIGEAA